MEILEVQWVDKMLDCPIYQIEGKAGPYCLNKSLEKRSFVHIFGIFWANFVISNKWANMKL